LPRIWFICVSLLTTPALAQSPAINLQLYRPAPDPNAVLATPSAEVSGHLNYHVGLSTNWSHRPLRLTIANEGVPLGDVIEDRVDVHLTASLGLWSFLQVGIDAPLVAYQHGINTEIAERVLRVSDMPAFGIGDLGFYAKGQLLAADGLLPAIALGAEVTAPTGDPAGFTGEPAAVLTP
jgi:hypothetical protein